MKKTFVNYSNIHNMKVYTKTGDLGETSLVGGRRTSKSSVRVNAYGDIDELISYLGVLRCAIPDESARLRRIQEVLMIASAHIASETDNPRLMEFPADETGRLEEEIDRMTSLIPPQKAFVLPAAPMDSSQCHVARCICRRAERSCVAICDSRQETLAVMRYLNRLSDYLFVLARYRCHVADISEDFWLV